MADILAMIGWRLLLGVLTLVAVSVLIFLSVQMLPGDSAEAILGQSATPETLAALRRSMKLDVPASVRYFAWIGNLLQGDLGTSLASGRPVSEMLRARLPNTIFLGAVAATLATPLSIVLGLVCALYHNRHVDRALNLVALGASSVPDFFIAYVLIIVFAVKLMIFPPLSSIGPDMAFATQLYQSVLPAVTLTLATTAYMMRMTRASVVSVLSSAYIEMAHLKGLPRPRVIWRHALPNAIGPIANVVALTLAYLISGVVVIETVFVYPGLGQLLVDSVSKRDIPVIQVVCMLFATLYILLNLTADVIATVSNPKMRRRPATK
jgi:peptide/nickel transport system permease protein